MLGYVEAILGGLADGGVDFCRARTLSPSSPAKCPDRGIVLGPTLRHLEAMVAMLGYVEAILGGLADGGGIFVGHEPFHLRAPQNAQIGGLFLGQRWAIWEAMVGHVGLC